MVSTDQIEKYPMVAKVPFMVPLDIRDGVKGGASKTFLMLLKKVFRTYSAETMFLLPKLKGGFRKVQILLIDKPSKIRVEYSPLTGIITLNTNARMSFKSKREGVVGNTLFALGMAYYDFGLSNTDRLYWRSLLQGGNPVSIAELNKSLSFSVESAGKQRLSFAGGFVRHFMGKPNETFERFFSEEDLTEFQLPSDRFQGLGLRSLRGVSLEVAGKTLSVKEALDLTGITSLTSEFRKLGGAFNLDIDENQGLFEFSVDLGNRRVLTMQRTMKNNFIENGKFFIAPEFQGKGLGLRAFSIQVEQAVASGVELIRTFAERDEEGGTVGYDIWWKFGYDGQLTASNSNNPSVMKSFLKAAVLEKIEQSSDMTIKRLFLKLLQQLRDSKEFSQAAYRYLLEQTLGGRYSDIKTTLSQTVPREDLLKLVRFFNKAFPQSVILSKNGLSFSTQSIQRLMELDNFSEFWTEYGKGWGAVADLRQGSESPTFAILSNYVRNRTATSEILLTETGGDFNKKDLVVISSIRKSLLNLKDTQSRVARNYVFKTKNHTKHS